MNPIVAAPLPCRHCGQSRDVHANGYCPFSNFGMKYEPVERKPDYRLLAEQLAAEIVGLRAALRKVVAELKWMPTLAAPCVGATNVKCVEDRIAECEQALEAPPHALVRELLAARELAEKYDEFLVA